MVMLYILNMTDISIEIVNTSVPFEAHYRCGIIPFDISHDLMCDALGGDTNLDGFFSGRVNGLEFILSGYPPFDIYSYEIQYLNVIRRLIIRYIKAFLNKCWNTKLIPILSEYVNHNVVINYLLPYIEYPFEYYTVTADDVFIMIDVFYSRIFSGNVDAYTTTPCITIASFDYSEPLDSHSSSVLLCATDLYGIICFMYLNILGFRSRLMYVPNTGEWLVWTTCPSTSHTAIYRSDTYEVTWDLMDKAVMVISEIRDNI